MRSKASSLTRCASSSRHLMQRGTRRLADLLGDHEPALLQVLPLHLNTAQLRPELYELGVVAGAVSKLRREALLRVREAGDLPLEPGEFLLPGPLLRRRGRGCRLLRCR